MELQEYRFDEISNNYDKKEFRFQALKEQKEREIIAIMGRKVLLII